MYTHNETRTRAFWVDFDPFTEGVEDDDDLRQFEWTDMVQQVGSVLEELGYSNWRGDQYKYYNGLFQVELESTYHGDGLVVRLEPLADSEMYHLALANHDRSYERIKKALLKAGFPLRIATSGYTSTALELAA